MAGLPTETLIKGIGEILLNACNNNIFTASSVAFFCEGYNKGNHTIISCGTTDDENNRKIDDYTLFDLASLTKPVVTLLSILTLIENKKLSWFDTLDSLLPGCESTSCNESTIFHLLSHSSGLPAHKEYWVALENVADKEKKNWLINEILKEKNVYEQGNDYIYSDLGYILLGFIIEEKSGQSLDSFWAKNIVEPLGLERHLMFPSPSMKKNSFAATRSFEKKVLQGIVHDDNCRAMGGVGGACRTFRYSSWSSYNMSGVDSCAER